ncbi:hypothetical protein [Sorangium atrum]|uniref:Uncharacterized protein n=1 Tax=Sorangium atrum TaxID=2995308 RepID=A0ABT5CKY9_9BACT|nr:hypothetical protein [Sorangium aterium]MDC0685747.1 hypothetical protein [Sorangium aterium]
MASFERGCVVILLFGAVLSGCGGEDDPALAEVSEALFASPFG